MPLPASMATTYSPVAPTYSRFLICEEEGSPLCVHVHLRVRRAPTWNPNTTSLNLEPNTENLNLEPNRDNSTQNPNTTNLNLEPNTDIFNMEPNINNLNPESNTDNFNSESNTDTPTHNPNINNSTQKPNTDRQLQPRTQHGQPISIQNPNTANLNPELQHRQLQPRSPTQTTHSEEVQKGYLEAACCVCSARGLGFRAALVGVPGTAFAYQVCFVGRVKDGKPYPDLRA